MKRIIVYRFSAMGDVAMVAAVLKEFAIHYPLVEIIMVSKKAFQPFFDTIPNLRFHALEDNGKHKGLLGLFKLFKELHQYRAHLIADLHNNLRSLILDGLFLVSDYSIRVLNKGRVEKMALTRSNNKILKPLIPTTERYANTLRALGFPFELTHQLVKEKRPIPAIFQKQLSAGGKIIGIAPFAKHLFKVFPLVKMEEVIAFLTQENYTIFIFGGSAQEKIIAENWALKYPKVYNTIGQIKLQNELDLIRHLDLMISMDSSGMHMASLVGTRCVSVWGATHPYAGFLGYGQSLEDCIQVPHPNRPSSVYGNKPCDCDGVEAIDLVTAEMIIGKVKSIIDLKH